MSGDLYNKQYFDPKLKGMLDSARVFLGYLLAGWVPRSVIDIGCGQGSWLIACKELGVQRLVGIDGSWLTQDMMLDPVIDFRSANLAEHCPITETYDLALSLEVAEHIPPEASDQFFSTVARASDAVLFSAAFVGQPGKNHINTRPHSFWAKKFIAEGYLLFDIFRSEFWDNANVQGWYRQNTFLYVKANHPLHHVLIRDGHRSCKNVGFVDCIHPWLYFYVLDQLKKQSSPPPQITNPTPIEQTNKDE